MNTDKIYEMIFKGENPKIEQLYEDMSKYQRRIFDNMKEDKKLFEEYRLKDLLFDFDAEFYETILGIELDAYIEECNKKGIENKRNGSTNGIEVLMGDRKMKFNRPRARIEKEYDSELIPKRTRAIADLEDNIILLYSKNNSINEIKEILEKMFGLKVSTGKISMMAQKLSEKLIEWRNRDIAKSYFTLNIDCTFISIRDERYKTSHKVPVYVAIGTKLDGHKEVAGMYLGNEDSKKNVIDELYNQDIGESKVYWMEVFEDLKERGLEDVLFVVSDGLAGIEEAVKISFEEARYQRCIVHLDRNIGKLVSQKEQKKVMKDFKKIYSASSLEEASLRFDEFMEQYQSKKKLIKKVEEYFEYIKPLYDVPTNIRKYIYTNNIVESANSKIKRGFYGRGSLPNVQSALNIIYVNLSELEEKWAKKKVENWKNIFDEINQFFKERITPYIE